MEVHGDFDMRENAIGRVRITAETNFPANPSPGRFCFKDKMLWVCSELDGDLPVWVPLTTQIDTVVFDQTQAAMEWTINHQLDTASPIVQIFDQDSNVVFPDSISNIFNRVTVRFAGSQAGRAVLMLGNPFGQRRQHIAYQNNYSGTTWVVDHMLGYYPIVRVFVNNNEVQPQSIVNNSLNRVTITFASSETGTVRCI